MAEQGEFTPLPEKPGHFRVYSGTTEKTFRKCAVVEKGIIRFDKTLAPSVDVETYYLDSLNAVIPFALMRSMELRSQPLIMSGLLGRSFYSGRIKMDPYEDFPVDSIWLAKFGPESFWSFVNKENGEEGFYRVDPVEFLNQKYRLK